MCAHADKYKLMYSVYTRIPVRLPFTMSLTMLRSAVFLSTEDTLQELILAMLFLFGAVLASAALLFLLPIQIASSGNRSWVAASVPDI